MRKLVVMLGIFAALAGLAEAGQKSVNTVIVDVVGRNAQGALGSARNSLDAVQYIGCTVTTGEGWFQTECAARNAAGVSVSCINLVDEGLRDAARSIGGDSWVYFSWDAGGNCEQIVVRNHSWHEPKR